MVKRENVDAELKKIAKRHNGILNAEDVVDEARDKKSTLHNLFDWDDTIAAEKWRLAQARNLIRISVNYLDGDDEKPYKVFVNLSEDRYRGEGGYRTLESVMNNKQLRVILLRDALKDMEIFTEKYSRLKELSQVFSAMRKVRVKLLPKQEQMQEVMVKVN